MKKVLVGISGGVDSSVSALLLQKQGYEVIGVTFKFIDMDTTDAEEVCKKLNIKHYVLDYQKEFKENIIDKFINDYKSGITPNPCVLCNKTMKLKILYEKMKELNCDFISTGHYAKVDDEGLHLSKDLNKDQTYFLCQVPKEILQKLIFPLEGLEKPEVRKIAAENDLITANKKDSTDVCFIPNGFKEFITKNIKQTPGDIVDIETNKTIGRHKGLAFYTLGQRRGIDVGGTKDRMFVAGKDSNKNILYTSTGTSNDYLMSNSCIVENVNLFVNEEIKECKAKFRYRQEFVNVEIKYIDEKTIEVFYPQGEKAVTPGQACVLYKDDICLGGGIIREIKKDNKTLWYIG